MYVKKLRTFNVEEFKLSISAENVRGCQNFIGSSKREETAWSQILSFIDLLNSWKLEMLFKYKIMLWIVSFIQNSERIKSAKHLFWKNNILFLHLRLEMDKDIDSY